MQTMDTQTLQTMLRNITAAIRVYMSKAKDIAEKKANFKVVFSTNEALRRITEIDGLLSDARDDANESIDKYCNAVIAKIDEWARLDGSQITDDAKLFEGGFILDDKEINELVLRYQDNYTMLKLIEQACAKAGRMIAYKSADDRRNAINELRGYAKRSISDTDRSYTANPDYAAYILESAEIRLKEFTDGTTLKLLEEMMSPDKPI
jgi:hypothetical protein